MSAEKNVALVQEIYAAFGRGDAPAILERCAQDVDWGVEAKASLEIPWHGTGKGKQFAAQFFQALGKEAVFTRFEPTGFLGSENGVACQVTWEAKLNRNGRTVAQTVLHYFVISNGKVTKWRGTEDTALTKAAWNATA